jgi:hypothetical protein
MVELISVHVPKCAGTSMRAALERAYGPASIYVDRESSPANPSSPAHLDPIGYRDRFRQHGYP